MYKYIKAIDYCTCIHVSIIVKVIGYCGKLRMYVILKITVSTNNNTENGCTS